MLKETNVVEKSNALVWAGTTNYGVNELKIFETYLSRIDARRPESARVTFTKKEYLQLLGLDPETKTSHIRKITEKLMSNVVSIELPGQGIKLRHLFSKVDILLDKDLKQNVIIIECDSDLREAFFDLSERGYIKYQLKNTINLRSEYSIRLYTYLMACPHGWTVSVEDLKEKLGVNAKKKNGETSVYDTFKRFNDLIIQKSVKEINEITNMRVEAETIKKGRKAVAVKFHILEILTPHNTSNDEVEEVAAATAPQEVQLSLLDNNTIPDADDPLAMIMSDLPFGFTREHAQVLRDLALPHVPYTVMSFEEKEMFISDYIRSKVLLMHASGAKNPFAWLRKAVEEDWK